jgi:hypothetical protein
MPKTRKLAEKRYTVSFTATKEMRKLIRQNARERKMTVSRYIEVLVAGKMK